MRKDCLSLTPAEIRVVEAILDGYTTRKSIAKVLNLAEGTIMVHLDSIYDKTDSQNMTALVLWCWKNGWNQVIEINYEVNFHKIPAVLRKIADALLSQKFLG